MWNRWNRGDDPGAVADRFLQANNLPMSNKPDIIAFIQQASGTPGAAAVAPPTSAPSAEVQQNMVNQIVEMGFDAAAARSALEASQWSGVEAALTILFQ